VRPLEGLGDAAGRAPVWLKNDGVYGGLWGGNKARKLEFLLADVLRRGSTTIVTGGAIGTNHGLATALHARELGLRCVLVLVDQPVDEHVRSQLARIEASGAELHRANGTVGAFALGGLLMIRRADWLPRPRVPYFMTVGGSSPLGCAGYVRAGLELARQVEAGELLEPSHVVVAVGSGGTVAGLLAGLRLAGLRSRLVGILVNDRTPVSERGIARLARRTLRLMRRRGEDIGDVTLSAGDLDLERSWLGAGYGHHIAAGDEATELLGDREGLRLEPVYTAKAVAGLLALNRRGAFGDGPVLYWHTYHSGGDSGETRT
jgi:D-cysteine desulfhydrase